MTSQVQLTCSIDSKLCVCHVHQSMFLKERGCCSILEAMVARGVPDYEVKLKKVYRYFCFNVVEDVEVEACIDTLADVYDRFCFKFCDRDEVEVQAEKKRFCDAFKAVVSSSSGRKELLAIIKAYKLQLQHVLEQEDDEISKMRERQSNEMNKVSERVDSSSQEDISLILERHMRDIEECEGKWANELSNIKRSQRDDFVSFIFTREKDVSDGDDAIDLSDYEST